MAVLWGAVLRLGACGSTNREAMQLAREGAPEGTVVVAGAQSAGRGRLGRSWHSPPGENLYLSIVLRPPCAPSEAPLLTLVAGVALVEAAALVLGAASGEVVARLKWPNDLLLGRRGGTLKKAGGILTEMACAGGRVDFVVVGIGCNVNTLHFPAELVATSLRAVLGAEAALPLAVVEEALLERLAVQYERFLAAGAGPVLRAFESHAAYLGGATPVTVRSGELLLSGIAEGIDRDGALLLRTADGALQRVVAGELALASA
jgi:BirA family biotin operon repressor/biotin-[acetyl-CoA-carboxylase] ligase